MPYVESDIDDFSEEELIDELERRGHNMRHNYDQPCCDIQTQEDIERLYLDYMVTGERFFTQQLKLFFNKYCNKTLR